MSPDRPPRPSRRSLLLAGGAGLVAIGAARLFADPEVTTAAPSPAAPEATAHPGVTAATTSATSSPAAVERHFDLAGPSHLDLGRVRLHEGHRSMQGIGYDAVNRRVFVVQQRDGRPGADLCINELTHDGKQVAHLHVDDAGHGQSFGVEQVGSASYLWLETDANENTLNGRGTALARFKFAPGRRPTMRKFFAGKVEVGCSIDPVHRRIAIRRPENGRTTYSVFNLADVTRGSSRPLWRFVEPSSLQPGARTPVLQGFTLLGAFVYILVGTGGHAGTSRDPFNSYLSAVDVRTGRVVQQKLISAGRTLRYREPEGLAINVVGGAPRLCFGFASRPSAHSSRRLANVFHLAALA